MKQFISADTKRVRRAVLTGAEFIAGLLLARISVSGLFSPFVASAVAVLNVPALIGALAGVTATLADGVSAAYIFAYISAAAAAYIISVSVPDSAYTRFGKIRMLSLISLGANAVAAVAFVLLSGGDFRRGLIILTGGGVSFAATYVIANAADRREKSSLSPKVRAICASVTASLLFLGILSFGGFPENIAVVLAVTSSLFVCARCGLDTVCIHTLITGLSFFIYDGKYIVFFAVLTLGGIGGSLLRRYGKHISIACFIAADVFFAIYYGGGSNTFSLIFSILTAGILYFITPMSGIGRMLKYAVPSFSSPSPSGSVGAVRKRTPFFGKIRMPDKTSSYYGICDKCVKRFACWIKDYDYTADVMNSMTAEAASDSFSVPSHFEHKCPNHNKIAEAIRRKNSKKEWTVNYAAASLAKDGKVICGDTYGAFLTDDGCQVLSILDGMGSGAGAAHDSVKASRLLEKLSAQGFERADALRIMNSAIVKERNESILGVDICSVNLTDGKCEFIKAGGAPSYVIRNGRVYSVGEATTPIGILDDVSFARHRVALADGDIAVMISDGMMCKGADFIVSSLSRITSLDAVSAADQIICDAAKEGFTSDDDITVIVARITRKQKH